MKILAFSPIKADATSFYRGFGPLNHLTRHDASIQVTNGSIEGQEITWDIVTQYDLLFFQRPSIFTDIGVMELAKRCRRPVVIDYDDDYLNIPPTNPRYSLYADPHRRAQILRAIEMADSIIVSTIAIRESIAENTGKSRDCIHVIPNGMDESLFSLRLIENLSLRDVVLWRGGDTHGKDIDAYLDKMVALYNEFPYKWAFMGHAPEQFLSKVDPSRVLLYPFDEIMAYFDRLFELRPMVTLCPWEDNPFNRAKSNTCWLESTLVGAPCLFPKWSTEFVEGMVGYHGPESFFYEACRLFTMPDLRKAAYVKSFQTLENRFTLEKLNPAREDLLREALFNGRTLGIHINDGRFTDHVEPYTDKQFFDYTWEHQLNQNFQQYAEGHFSVAEWLYNEFKPNSVVELGCGPGPMVEKFCDLRVPQVAGFELNPYFQDYFVKRNPHYAHAFMMGDFLEADLTGVFDLCISIEVFEHIPHEKLMPFIRRMADHFKVLYFSSTPYRSSQRFDRQWGHVNLKTHEEWVKLFTQNGFKYAGNPKKITIWDALFISERAESKRAEELQEEHLSQ